MYAHAVLRLHKTESQDTIRACGTVPLSSPFFLVCSMGLLRDGEEESKLNDWCPR
jgi:hypothetical protein